MRARRQASWAGGLAAVALAATPLFAQPVTPAPSVLPPGPAVNLGDLRDSLSRAFADPPTAGPLPTGFTITPAIGVTEEYTDNANQTGRGARSDLITIITPSIVVSGDSPRLSGTFSYAPSLQIYASQGRQTRIGQNLNARGLFTVVPDLFYVDTRALLALTSGRGGLGPTGVSRLSRNSETQSSSFSVSPYLTHRFGDFGTAEIGAGFSQSSQDSRDRTGRALRVDPRLDPFLLTSGPLNSDLTTTSEHAAFTTGEFLGRTNIAFLAALSQLDGSGVLRNAKRDTYTADAGYALTRKVTLLGTLGWEDIRYAGTPPTRINDAIWNVGVRLTPSDASSITVRYGHKDGFNAASFQGSYAPTARLRFYGSYNEGLASQQELLQNALANADVDPFGFATDRRTGAPLVPVDNYFGSQGQDLFRQKTLSLTGVLQQDRDTYSVTLSKQSRKRTATATAGLSNTSDDGVTGSASWGHDLSEDLRSSVFAQYGTRSAKGLFKSDEQTFVGSASLTYLLSETLSGTAQYSFTRTTSNVEGGSLTENLVVLGLRKTF